MKVKRRMKWMLEGGGRQDEERVNRLRSTAADRGGWSRRWGRRARSGRDVDVAR